MRPRPETKRKLLKEAGWARHDRTQAGKTIELWQPPPLLGCVTLPSVTFAAAWRHYQKRAPP